MDTQINTKPRLREKIQKVFYKTSVSFTLIVLLFTSVMYISQSETTDVLAPTMTMLMCILLFSFILALSDFIFDTKKLGSTAKRLIHFFINFISLIVCFFLIPGKIKLVKELIIISFVFLLLYVLLLGLGALIRKLSEKVQNF